MRPDTTAAVQMRDVSVDRGDRRVLSEVSLRVEPGQLCAVLGPNGAGKSTLVGALSGTIALGAGSVELSGDDIAGLSPVQQARRRAVLPQEHVVGFSFTCREVVQMGRFPWNRTRRNSDDDAAVAAAMTECGVSEFADRPFSTLSGGERARVALARVFAQETTVLVLDEPTAALDLQYQESVMELVRARVDAGAAALVIVHDLSLAASFADTTVMLDHGRVAAAGPPATTLTAQRVEQVYGVDVVAGVLDGQPVIVPRRRRS